MAPRWSRYTRIARKRGCAGAAPIPNVLCHYGDEFDEVFRHDGRLRLAPRRKYTPRVPQTWDDNAAGVDREPVNPVNQLGPIYADQIPVVTANDYGSFMAAFDKRSNAQPDVDDDAPKEVIDDMIAMIRDADCEFEPFDEDCALRDSWMSKFSAEKCKRMEEAMIALGDVALDDPFLAHKTLSVKIEVLLKRNDPTWAPRLIYASNDEFNALTGPIVNEVCSRLNHLLLRGLGPVKFMMGYKRQDLELAAFICDEKFPHIAEGDYSANDLTQCRSVARVYDALCEKVGAPQWLRTLLMAHVKFTVAAPEFGLKAKLQNQLPTGTTITTSRNTIWNACMFAWHARREGNRGIALVLGDDLLAAMVRKVNLVNWQVDVSACKMRLKAAAPALSGEATFLSRRFCYDGEVGCMMPKLFKALARFNCRGNDNQAVSDSAYMAGKSLCYAYEFRHFPDLRDMFLERYRSEPDRAHIVAEEVSWFTRQSGVDLSRLEKAVVDEPVTCSFEAYVEFIFDAYGLDASPTDIYHHARHMILGGNRSLEQTPAGADVDF